MGKYISTGDGVEGYINVDPYWDDAEENDTVYLYWGRSGSVCHCISLLETVW